MLQSRACLTCISYLDYNNNNNNNNKNCGGLKAHQKVQNSTRHTKSVETRQHASM